MFQNPFSHFDPSKTLNKQDMHQGKNESILNYLRENETHLILDLGAENSAIRHRNVIQVELYPCENTTVASTAESTPFRINTFDAVFCSMLLEHVPNPFRVSNEIKIT